MADILKFNEKKYDLLRMQDLKPACHNFEAEVIIFPGVRYEHNHDLPEARSEFNRRRPNLSLSPKSI